MRLKIAKIFFFVGALCFVARPFFGFSIFSKYYRPVEKSILLKIFSKRKLEMSEDCSYSFSAVEKKLPNPGVDFFPGFDCFQGNLFFCAFRVATINNRALRVMQPPPSGPGWLLYRKIII
jgi:hypothetical protein